MWFSKSIFRALIPGLSNCTQIYWVSNLLSQATEIGSHKDQVEWLMNLAMVRKRKNEPKKACARLAGHRGDCSASQAFNNMSGYKNSSCSSTYCAYEYFGFWLMNIRSTHFAKFKGVCVVGRAWERTCNCRYESHCSGHGGISVSHWVRSSVCERAN